MVIQCTEKEERILLDYLKQEAVYHTFLLADIANFGFDHEFQTVYGDIRDDQVYGVYLKFYGNLIVAGRAEDIDEGFLQKLFESWKPDVVMGKEAVVNRIFKLLPDYTASSKGLYALEQDLSGWKEKNYTLPEGVELIKGQPGDEHRIHSFLMEIPEIRAMYTSKEMIGDRLRNGDGTHLFLVREGKIIAHVNSAAKSPYYVMIGGVAVCEEERGQHLSAILIEKLCREILEEGRKPCCFSDRGEEHNIFVQMGFEKAGFWGTLTKPEEEKKPLADNKLPSYIWIYNRLYQDIIDGVYEKDSLLPSETVMAADYKVSRNTLRQALAILCQDGYIYKRQGKGTFVSYDSGKKERHNICNFLRECSKEPVSNVIMDYNLGLPTNIAKRKLELSEGEEVIASNNVYRGEDGPIGQSFLQIPMKQLEQAGIEPVETEEDKLLDFMEHGIYKRAVSAAMTIQVMEADEQVIPYLEVSEGMILLHIEQLLYSSGGSPIARIKYYFIPDKYQVDCLLKA